MSTESLKKLLTSFTKSNKIRKESLAQRAGFSSAEVYRAHLKGLISGKVSPTKTKTKKDNSKKEIVHVVNILDRSGSMGGGKINNAVTGINNELSEFRKATDVNYNVTLVTFDDSIRTEYFNTPVERATEVSVRPGNTTALFQAIGETLVKLQGIKEDQRILVNIFTDGQENASRGVYSNRASLKELIKQCEGLGYTITFIGTSTDVAYVTNNLNIDVSNSLIHDNTPKGVMDSFASKLSATVSYSASVSRGASKEELLTGFYKQSGTL